ncbi:MAG: N-6 DNA methylase, partial [Spirochaetes bacterium]|nr:N-6 DNA methylase [Spirochaetota bacterium]
LEQITDWRETLAKNIALRNKELSVEELNEAVQRILDRLLFIRNLEDREIEPENTLLDKTKAHADIYKSIIPIFRNLDNVYNGLLFKKHFSEDLIVDDKAIKDIIKNMCYPVSPFQFDVIEPEILGRIYEKFLGSKIRLTESHQAKVEEKMEVRKAGGVYYTPEYIVDYIVKNTVGKKIEGLTPEEIKKIKIVDPACGSGSFLLGAYSFILDYHARWYSENKKDKAYKNDYYINKDGELKVNLEKRGDILRNNIFGVDIDKEATEVAIMSLYLKMLDDGFDKGERDLFFIKGHVLPDMTSNVKCGNSLIGTDYFEGKLDFDIEEMKEIKPFDWDKEFADIFKNGGFDCVIGNPPYLYSAGKENLDYLKNRYNFSEYQTDYYVYFIEKSTRLSKKSGLFSFIVPDSWLNSENFSKMRTHLLSEQAINTIAIFNFFIFEGVSLENSVFNITVGESNEKIEIITFSDVDKYSVTNSLTISDCLSENIINPYKNEIIDSIINKIEINSSTLSNILKVNRGLHAYRTDGYGISKFTKGHQTKRDKDEQSYHSEEKIDETYLPEIKGKNLFRYYYEYSGLYLSYGEWLAEPRTSEFFINPKIVLRKILGDRLFGSIIDEPAAIDQSIYICIERNNDMEIMKQVLGVLVSSIGAWYLKNKHSIFDTLYPWYTKKQLDAFPIKISSDMSLIVDQMLQTQKDSRNAKSEADKKLYEQKISMIDKKIDELVYKLYGLTDDEIKIVEGE